MSAAAARKAENANTSPQLASESIGTEPVSSRQTKVTKFMVGDDQFAVLSVPLSDGSLMESLSTAEREVAALAAAGLKNAAIAAYRHTSVRTVANQMAAVLRKLGVSSRYQLAARLALHPLKERKR
jgi:DNA-binding NarL/FixJ family response regulator